MKHPIQPLANDKQGVLRFKPNKIVEFLAEGKLNELARMDFPQEDWEQLAQLIGYSLAGYGSLSYVTDETYATAEAMSKRKKLTEEQARINALEATLEQARAGIKQAACAVFRIHEDDLNI